MHIDVQKLFTSYESPTFNTTDHRADHIYTGVCLQAPLHDTRTKHFSKSHNNHLSVTCRGVVILLLLLLLQSGLHPLLLGVVGVHVDALLGVRAVVVAQLEISHRCKEGVTHI
jgi:predicted exporter